MTRDVAGKREVIMKTALKLFTERGFHGTPTSMISEQAGVATGTLFRYFPTKEELINNIYFDVKEKWGKSISEGINREDTIKEKIQRAWANSIRWGISCPDEFLFIEQFSSSPYITKITQEEAMKNYLFLFEIFQEGTKNGILKDLDMRMTVNMLAHAGKSVIRLILDSSGSADADKLVDESFELIWGGISKK
ncbi:TetR family transcriptional regulator [Methanocella sp. CWC-04]|uniref:TetR family transcriptional regulator n=1 Tax=Methanooceanicella nereidis TaxID=2052831 RepID=A0AAP2RAC0_9EURY|nr:TetR/AcrR family transcriptional regulator [Methanocella sp. CWC-04]MCD1293648.1 TetR family transcriptional regulator [Methanocella sp. CWC-04]